MNGLMPFERIKGKTTETMSLALYEKNEQFLCSFVQNIANNWRSLYPIFWHDIAILKHQNFASNT